MLSYGGGTLMMMMNCFCGMVDQRKTFSLISSRDNCQRSSPSRISDTPRAGFFVCRPNLFCNGKYLVASTFETSVQRALRAFRGF